MGKGTGNRTTEYDSITNRILCGYAREAPHCMIKCLEFLPFRSSATSCARSAWHRLATSAKLQATLGQQVKKAGSGIQCHKNVLGRQIQYTHTHFCYLVLGRGGKGEGQDTVTSPVPSTWNWMNRITVFTSV